jgi:hypothetical protein
VYHNRESVNASNTLENEQQPERMRAGLREYASLLEARTQHIFP